MRFSTGHRVLDYAVLDVFAESPLAGNPLAVFTDASGLMDEEMQALARETNLSETTFILPRDADVERECGIRVRIFTTREELKFAGHPTLGTATWLYLHHPLLQGAETITLDLPVGQIPVRFPIPNSVDLGVFGMMRQSDPVFGQIHDRSEVAAALNLSIEDLDPVLPIQTVSTGLAFCIVPLRSVDVAGRLAIPQHVAMPYLEKSDARFFHCICRAHRDSGADWHARMQFYGGEDPATGSASGCAAAYLVRHGAVPNGKTVVIEQGVEILRPSRIHIEASSRDGKVNDVYVGGRTIPVATGRFFLP
jgi:trans-2,3-dihydro-3-hydroxyanthranilate isomerase